MLFKWSFIVGRPVKVNRKAWIPAHRSGQILEFALMLYYQVREPAGAAGAEIPTDLRTPARGHFVGTLRVRTAPSKRGAARQELWDLSDHGQSRAPGAATGGLHRSTRRLGKLRAAAGGSGVSARLADTGPRTDGDIRTDLP